jgi:uncharacterized protein
MNTTDDGPRDHAGMEVLGFAECLDLAASRPVGRVAFIQDGDVQILPVNHCVHESGVAFRTADGSKLGAAMDGAVVAFEVDDIDDEHHTGWSVLIKGRADLVTDETLVARLSATAARPWSDRVPRSNWVAIHPDTVTGRRI